MKFIEEIWKPVVGYEGIYEVSSLGRVKSCERTIIRSNGREINFPDKIMKPSINHKGYLIIDLRKNGKRSGGFVHRLVGKAFIDNPLNKEQINHKNGNKTDNRVQNLEWVTNQENMAHAYKFLGRTNKDASESRKRVVEQLSDDFSVISVFSSIKKRLIKQGLITYLQFVEVSDQMQVVISGDIPLERGVIAMSVNNMKFIDLFAGI